MIASWYAALTSTKSRCLHVFSQLPTSWTKILAAKCLAGRHSSAYYTLYAGVGAAPMLLSYMCMRKRPV